MSFAESNRPIYRSIRDCDSFVDGYVSKHQKSTTVLRKLCNCNGSIKPKVERIAPEFFGVPFLATYRFAMRRAARGSKPGKGEIFHTSPDGSPGHPAPYTMGNG